MNNRKCREYYDRQFKEYIRMCHRCNKTFKTCCRFSKICPTCSKQPEQFKKDRMMFCKKCNKEQKVRDTKCRFVCVACGEWIR